MRREEASCEWDEDDVPCCRAFVPWSCLCPAPGDLG
jgi:hypothetical protein